MNKKIILYVIALVLIAIAAWFFLWRSRSTEVAPDTLTNVLPFGSGEDSAPGTSTPTNPLGGEPTDVASAHLYKLSSVPVAGAVAIMKSGGLVVRYAERATGHIVDVDPLSLSKVQIVNTTIPKLYKALWRPDGSSVVFRTLRNNETAETISYELIPPSGTSTADTYTTKSFGFPANISDIAVGITKVFYTVKNQPQIVSANFDGTKTSTLWTSNFTEWNLNSAGDSSLVLTTKPSGGADSYAYNLNPKTGSVSKLIGPSINLSVLPNTDTSRIAYSASSVDGVNLYVLSTKSGQSAQLARSTIADKCVWSNKVREFLYCGVPNVPPSSKEPTLWYQGLTHYSDRIWREAVDSQVSDMLVDPLKEFGVSIDVMDPFLSPNEDYLFFTNHNDLSLWALKLVD